MPEKKLLTLLLSQPAIEEIPCQTPCAICTPMDVIEPIRPRNAPTIAETICGTAATMVLIMVGRLRTSATSSCTPALAICGALETSVLTTAVIICGKAAVMVEIIVGNA